MIEMTINLQKKDPGDGIQSASPSSRLDAPLPSVSPNSCPLLHLGSSSPSLRPFSSSCASWHWTFIDTLLVLDITIISDTKTTISTPSTQTISSNLSSQVNVYVSDLLLLVTDHRRPGKDSDYTQHALNTVVAAAGAVHNQARASNPAICERPHIR